MNAVDMPADVSAATRTEDLLAAVRAIAQGPLAGPLVVSCGNQRRQSVVVVAPCGHVGKSQSGLSTCPCGLVVHELEAVS